MKYHAFNSTLFILQCPSIPIQASLTCIGSLISQLPHLTSLNLSDCPNIRTLAPLATALAFPHEHDTAQAIQDGFNLEDFFEERVNNPRTRRALNLRHLWVRGCNLSTMSADEWAMVFDALSECSSGLERLTLSRNNMTHLHPNIGKLKQLTYLFVEDNYCAPKVGGIGGGNTMKGDDTSKGFEMPDELGNLSKLRFISFCGNNINSLPRTMGRLNDNCDIYLHRNYNLTYPPREFQRNIKTLRQYFHEERMSLLRGTVLFMPHFKRARWRANERLYRPGGIGYMICKERFEDVVRRTSVTFD